MKMSKIHVLSIITTLIISGGTLFAQTLTYQTTNTPVQLVDNILAGAGVVATNITYNGSAVTANSIQASARSFTATGFPFQSGVYLRTAGATTVASDPDLQAIALGNPTNGAILEFDFVATGNELNFNYIFASSEYTGYTCSGFNDAFGFFLSGPGIAGPFLNGAVNLAVVPGGNIPVSINTVNSGVPSGGNPAPCVAADPNWLNNTVYFNPTAYNGFSGEGYNGSTISMVAQSELICGETYHIKLAVCNVLDQILNSGVYLEAGSFTTNPIDFTFNSYTLDNTVSEGCDELGTLMFTRQGCGNENDTLEAFLTFTGTATNGVDYELLGTTVTLLPGVDTIYWQLLPFEDGLIEGIESVDVLVAAIDPITGDTLYSTGQFFISDVPDIIIDPADVTYLCFQGDSPITATVSGGFEPYEYLWENGSTDVTTQVPISGNGVTYHTVTITDACGYVEIDSVMVTMNQTISIDTIIMGPATCEPVGYVSAIISGQTNPINVIFEWENGNDPTITYPDASALPNLGGGWYILTLTDDNIPCSVTDSVFVETIENPVANGSISPEYGCSPVVSTFTNTSQNATSYTWDFGNGNVQTVNNTNAISQTFTNNATITLTASNGFPACDDEITLSVQVVICGCTNPIALNYNDLAVIDDGSCILPTPTVIAPNVFTANGDDVNPYFALTTTNAEKIELTIVNRWGNLVFEGNGNQLLPPFWDGKDKSGNPVEDGVYFYTYLVTGVAGDEVEGHGFVEVVR